ncbi:MAG: hypothetical protein V4706_14740 [Pseudomonadota bacterium]
MSGTDELASLGRDIDALDGAQAAPAAEAALVEKTNAAAGWAEIPAAVGLIVGMFLPGAKAGFSEDACQEWGTHMAKVADKYGWSADGLPPEVAVILCTAGMALPVVIEVKKLRNSPEKTGEAGHGQAAVTG